MEQTAIFAETQTQKYLSCQQSAPNEALMAAEETRALSGSEDIVDYVYFWSSQLENLWH